MSRTFYLSKTQTESGDSVALIKKWLLSKDFTNFFMIILLPEFFKCKPSFPNFFRCDVVIINKVKTRFLTLFCRALFTSFIKSEFSRIAHVALKIETLSSHNFHND